ncbi:hypothetical protein GGF37_002731 [Kickxella alabastrina]|nr:hypothetical protein GGF37_002731 [Kickxella alabastrina]
MTSHDGRHSHIVSFDFTMNKHSLLGLADDVDVFGRGALGIGRSHALFEDRDAPDPDSKTLLPVLRDAEWHMNGALLLMLPSAIRYELIDGAFPHRGNSHRPLPLAASMTWHMLLDGWLSSGTSSECMWLSTVEIVDARLDHAAVWTLLSSPGIAGRVLDVRSIPGPTSSIAVGAGAGVFPAGADIIRLCPHIGACTTGGGARSVWPCVVATAVVAVRRTARLLALSGMVLRSWHSFECHLRIRTRGLASNKNHAALLCSSLLSCASLDQWHGPPSFTLTSLLWLLVFRESDTVARRRAPTQVNIAGGASDMILSE